MAISVENRQCLPPCVFNAPAERVSLELGMDAKKKTRMIGLADGRKSFKIGLAVQT